MANIGIVSMNNGEISPLIESRTDVEKYSSSCRHLENFLGLMYGGVARRPGLVFVAESTVPNVT